MSIDLTRTVVERDEKPAAGAGGPLASGKTGTDAARAAQQQRDQLQRVAQEFESMLLRQVLRDMRRAGAWEDEPKGFGAETMGDVIEAELATHLARNKGLGLAEQMLSSLDRMARGTTSASPFSMPSLSSMPSLPSIPELPDMPSIESLMLDAVAGPAGGPDQPSPYELRRSAEGSAKPEGSPLDVTSGFGWRRDPINGRQTFHRGIDLAAYYGQNVVAARDGRVVFSGEQGGYGTTVLVEHQDGTKSRYAHLSQALVEPGTMVTAGQILGQAGSSGRATGTHLHFEVTSADGEPLSPSEWSNGVIG